MQKDIKYKKRVRERERERETKVCNIILFD